MEDIRYCLESFHMKLSCPQHWSHRCLTFGKLTSSSREKKKVTVPHPLQWLLFLEAMTMWMDIFVLHQIFAGCCHSSLCQGIIRHEPRVCCSWSHFWDQWARAQCDLDIPRHLPALELQHISTLHTWVPRDQLFTSNSSDLAQTTSQTSGSRSRALSFLLAVRQSFEEVNKRCQIPSKFLPQHPENISPTSFLQLSHEQALIISHLSYVMSLTLNTRLATIFKLVKRLQTLIHPSSRRWLFYTVRKWKFKSK